MTLTDALRSATSALAGNAKHASILSRNVSGVGDPNYVRRDALVSTQLYGTIKVDIQRYVHRSLYNATITANGEAANANVVMSGIDQLAHSMGIDDFSNSPASMLGSLREAVELAAVTPSSLGTSTSLIERGRIFASTLNDLYAQVLAERSNADKEIASSVTKLNSLLGQLETVNDRIVMASHSNEDALDSIDMRDNILEQMSQEVGIKVVPRDHNDIMVMTNNGLLLFESRARTVSFQPTSSYGSTTVGNTLLIDGVPASGDEPWLPVTTGRLGGNFKLRDDILMNQQNQLDEIARSVIELFAEEDQSIAGVKPKLTGMFTWDGGPAVPPSGVTEPGIAASISINALIDPQTGGNPELIRDGGINGDPDYIYNPTGASGFSDRLYALSSAFSTPAVFDPQAGLPVNLSLIDFAASSLDWLHSTRQSAHDVANYKGELAVQYSNAYQSEAGTNLDTEMSKLLEVERAYQASAKLLATIDEMFSILLNAVRTR
ncbi:MAG: flagellar hook-associated protein FlgK [Hyphomicrobiales bacterium]|nr:flagellar hook-associated protein FlgK [Hyphomicrobiales bacterium]